MESPEVTGRYECASCDNTRAFIGYDDRGYPGPEECDCGQDPCQCQATLKQPFVVQADGSVDYHEFEGGGFGAEIGSYTRIQCAVCEAFIWTESMDAAEPLPGPANR